MAQPQLAQRLAQLKLASGAMTSTMTEQIIYRVLSDGDYARHINRVQAQLFSAAQRVSKQLRQLGFAIADGMGEGLFIWARLPPGMDAQALSEMALQQHIALAPGNLFSQAASAASICVLMSHIRISALWQWLSTALACTETPADTAA